MVLPGSLNILQIQALVGFQGTRFCGLPNRRCPFLQLNRTGEGSGWSLWGGTWSSAGCKSSPIITAEPWLQKVGWDLKTERGFLVKMSSYKPGRREEKSRWSPGIGCFAKKNTPQPSVLPKFSFPNDVGLENPTQTAHPKTRQPCSSPNSKRLMDVLLIAHDFD